MKTNLNFLKDIRIIVVFLLVSALAGAWLLHYTEKKFPDIQEAIIGTVFVLTATGSILLLAGNPHSSEHLKELLSGQILWVSNSKLLLLLLFSLGVAILWWRLSDGKRQRWFYLLFAVAITASVQVVGIYLVFSSLILPALAVYRLRQHALKIAFLIGSSSYLIGLLLSTLFDLPAGPLIVWLLAANGGLFLLWHKRSATVLMK